MTTALGGSITIEEKDESLTRIEAPLSIIRIFSKQFKRNRFLIAIDVIIGCYDGNIVSIEAVQEGIPTRTPKIVNHLNNSNDYDNWHCDGRSMFLIDKNTEQSVSKDNKFVRYATHSFDFKRLCDLTSFKDVVFTNPIVVKYTTSSGQSALSPPIFSNSHFIKSRIDTLDEMYFVNISFVLFTSKILNEIEGFEAILPFNLHKLMISYKTVNLSALPSQIKKSANCGMTPTNALVWIMAKQENCTSIEKSNRYTQILKYLITKGISSKADHEVTNWFKVGKSFEDIPKKVA